MAFVRWDPIRDLLAIQHRPDRFAPAPAGWTPPVDLLETADAYVIVAELPGVDRNDLTISLHDDGRLTVAGVRRERSADEYHRIERGHGSFSRTFHLPIPVDADSIKADLRDGVLIVTCPKAQEGGGRRIHISP
jgi:HSP20 family protein